MTSSSRTQRLSALLMKPWFWLIIGTVLLAVASLSGAPMGNDEGVWAYIGRIWVEHGLLPYTGAIENKATGIYLVYALSHLLFGFQIWFPRLLALFSALGTGYLLYRLIKKMIPPLIGQPAVLQALQAGEGMGGVRAGIFAMAIFLLIMPLQSVDGPYAETETFMNLFRVLGFFLTVLAYEKEKKRIWWLFAAGASSAIAISFKQLAVLDAIPLVAFHIYLSRNETRDMRTSCVQDLRNESTPMHLKAVRPYSSLISHLSIVFIGALAGLGLTLAPYLASGGTIHDFIQGAIVLLFQSGSSPASLVSRISGFFWHFFNVRLAFLTFGILGFLALRKYFSKNFWWFVPLLVWALTDFAAYNADGWYLDHHFKVFIGSWAVIFGIVLDYVLQQIRLSHVETSPHAPLLKGEGNSEDDQKKFFVIASIALLIFYIPFESNYFQSIRKAIKGNVYDTNAEDLGRYMRKKTSPSDYIYVWGLHIGPTYYFSDRLSPGRYFSEPFLGVPGALAEIERDMALHPPKFILVPVEREPVPEWLQGIIQKNYTVSETKFGHNIYRKKV